MVVGLPDPKVPVPQDCGILTIMTPGAAVGSDNVDGGISPEGAWPVELRG